MNHDYAHCLDFKEDCTKNCFRAQLVRDLHNNPSVAGIWLSWMNFRGTAECMRKEKNAVNDFARERDAAFIHFVKTDDLSKVRAYCKKWGVQMPKSKKVAAAGVYKAVAVTTSIPEDIKIMAMQKCLKLGFNPFIKPYDA